jgi:hypothetical protein
MKRLLQAAVVLLVLILMAVTNPTKEAHQKAFGKKLSQEHGVVGKLGGEVYSGFFNYRDYVFFSLTRHDGEIKTVGILGMVFTL